eukprot:Rhum_TRINITY_DN15003_c2_g5::Rhum_TRINITY_DN15003_c2_g5_i2::g.133086::m.133086
MPEQRDVDVFVPVARHDHVGNRPVCEGGEVVGEAGGGLCAPADVVLEAAPPLRRLLPAARAGELHVPLVGGVAVHQADGVVEVTQPLLQIVELQVVHQHRVQRLRQRLEVHQVRQDAAPRVLAIDVYHVAHRVAVHGRVARDSHLRVAFDKRPPVAEELHQVLVPHLLSPLEVLVAVAPPCPLVLPQVEGEEADVGVRPQVAQRREAGAEPHLAEALPRQHVLHLALVERGLVREHPDVPRDLNARVQVEQPPEQAARLRLHPPVQLVVDALPRPPLQRSFEAPLFDALYGGCVGGEQRQEEEKEEKAGGMRRTALRRHRCLFQPHLCNEVQIL